MLAGAEPCIGFAVSVTATNVEDLIGDGWIRETEPDLKSGRRSAKSLYRRETDQPATRNV
jgi:hypothetical protein